MSQRVRKDQASLTGLIRKDISAVQTGKDTTSLSGVDSGLTARSVVNVKSQGVILPGPGDAKAPAPYPLAGHRSKAGKSMVAGIDEAGRGCLAGPVVAAAVILPADCQLEDLADSKKLSARQRQALQAEIKAVAVSWAVGLVRPERIDGINILEATLEAMAMAAGRLRASPSGLLIDGNKVIQSRVLERHWRHAQALPAQRAIVDGDALVPAISAASILAKTFRDRIMEAMDRRWPEYGFARHKGYGTKQHYAALASFGPCPQHRLSFRGVKA